MSDDSKKDSGFFSIETSQLRVGDPLPVDCFGHLVKNQKYIQWARKGDLFTDSRKNKLLALGFPVIFAPTVQRAEYEKYAEEHRPVVEEGGYSAAETVREAAKTFNHRIFGSTISEKSDRRVPAKQPISKVPAGGENIKAPKMKVSVDFVNTIITSTQKLFLEQFSIPVKFKAATKRVPVTPGMAPIDIASFILLTSQTIRGTMGLCFPNSTYLYLLSQATEFQYSEIAPELCAGACEFLYPIYEEARPQLVELGYSLDPAVPTLVIGKDLSLSHIIPDNGFSVIFESQGGNFQLEIGIKTGM